jgi:hypothetical protein
MVLAAVCGRITKEASPITIARLKTNCGQAKSMIACTNGSFVARSNSLRAQMIVLSRKTLFEKAPGGHQLRHSVRRNNRPVCIEVLDCLSLARTGLPRSKVVCSPARTRDIADGSRFNVIESRCADISPMTLAKYSNS